MEESIYFLIIDISMGYDDEGGDWGRGIWHLTTCNISFNSARGFFCLRLSISARSGEMGLRCIL
jgi:hypothetical protein